MSPRCAILPLMALALAALAVSGCQSPANRDYQPLLARFYLEVKPGEAGVPVRLPTSGVTINVGEKPVFAEYDIVNVEIAQVELGQCLLLQLSPAAARDLYRLSVASLGRRLVLSLNSTLVGARRIDQAMADGNIMIFVELPDVQLPDMVARLKRTSADLAAAARKAKH